MNGITVKKSLTLSLTLWLCLIATIPAQAYDIEANSTDNSIYVLLNNPEGNSVFSSISLTIQSPSFISSASATFIPSAINSNRSDVLSLNFDVYNNVSLGNSGDMTINISGIVAGQLVSFPVTIPLTVVSNSDSAQGEIGAGIPPTNGDTTDSDGDGISDVLEIAFGSDANNIESYPGGPIIATVPMLNGIAFLLLACLIARAQRLANRATRSAGEKS
jgi:hypothetical protein